MARHFSRLLPLVRWRYLRWGLMIPSLPLALWACNSHPLQQPLPSPQMETDFPILLAPERKVDILFLVDNSPSMDPKQQALAKNFPLMINELDKLPDGRPDLHIGVVSSDMGAGGSGIGGNCNVVLGDRGLLWGNVPTDTSYYTSNVIQDCFDKAPVRATVAPGSCWAINHKPPITDGCGLNSGARWIEDVQAPNGAAGRVMNYSGGPTALSTVFSCLATAVGVGGCGFEHQLQAVRVALNPQKIGCDDKGNNCTDVNLANLGFLRDSAYLAIILITDEDDCSAEPDNGKNDNLFTNDPRDPNVTSGPGTETASMRCAARGDLCNGSPIPNYVDPARGYDGTGFTAVPFSQCTAKDQTMQGVDNGILPLITVQDMIKSVSQVKSRPTEQILVSGIFGWLPDPNDTDLPSDLVVSDKFEIGKDTTSQGEQAKEWDYMPICKIPSQTSNDGNIYKAYGGLRLKKFVDAFQRTDPTNGTPIVNTFSICKSNFTSAMTQIGQAIAKKLLPGCVDYPLVDIQPRAPDPNNLPPIQPECQALDRQPCDSSIPGSCVAGGNGYNEKSLFECKDGQGKPLDPTLLDPAPPKGAPRTPQQITAVLDTISQDQRPCWYLSYDNSLTGCPNSYKGQRISALRKTGTVAPPGTQLAVKCLTCSNKDINGGCAPLNNPPPTP